jgi:GTPase SAR1 family protein
VAGWKRWAVALITLLVGATVIILPLSSPGGLESATRIAALVVGLAPLALSVIVWARRRPSVAAAISTPEQVDAAQRQLADQVMSQWRNEIVVRQLDDPGPLAVRWRFTELDVVDRAEHIARPDLLRSLIGRGRPRFTGRTDRIGEIATEFRKLARRRLVILGDPGTGKTTLALLLLRELLRRAEPHDPVPVLVSMSDWDPGAESLSDWLTRRLTDDYPALRAAVFGPSAPRSLVTGRRILPILDGLDELPEESHPRIIARLNEVAADPLVLTCRTAEYQAAVAAPGGDVLTGGAVIEPSPLTPTDAARYVSGCLPSTSGNGWPDLLATLKGDRRSPVTTALSTPLALWLLRKVYVDPHANPIELLDTGCFPTADTIVEHLLDHLVNALITVNPPQDKDDEHPFRPSRAWDPADATRWLAFLAGHLNRIGSRDLAWWQLRRAAPRVIAVAVGVVAGLTMGLAIGLHDGLRFGLATGVANGVVLGLVFGFAVGIATGFSVWHVLALILGLFILGAGVSAGLVAGEPVLGLAFAVAGSIPVAVVTVLSAKGIGFTPAQGPAYADLRLRGRMRLLRRRLTSWDDGRLLSRFVPGFTIGFAYGLILGAVDEIQTGVALPMTIGLVFGLTTWLAIGLTDWAETPVTDERPQTPTTTFRRDLQLVCVKSLAIGFALAIAFGIPDALADEGGLLSGLAIGLLAAIILALGVGLHQASGRYLVTVLVLRHRRRIPLRLLSFLDDAHRLGILRQAGPVYQFRHAKLQDRLAHTNQ